MKTNDNHTKFYRRPIASARRVLRLEAEAVAGLSRHINRHFVAAVRLILSWCALKIRTGFLERQRSWSAGIRYFV